MTIFSLTEAELRQRRSLKWRTYDSDVLPLWVAEMDAAVQPAVRAELDAALDRGDTGYPWGTEYADAYRASAATRWGLELDPTQVRRGGDVMNEVLCVLETVTNPGDGIVITAPVYPPFWQVTSGYRRHTVAVDLTPEGRLDLAALERAFAADDVTAFLLCSPHNPTGTVHTAAELTELATLADGHQVLVVSDEIHAPLTHPGATFTPYLSLDAARRGIALVSGSKSWNIAGLKAALAVPGADARATLGRLHEVVRHGANHLAVIAQTAAFRDGGPWLAQVGAELEENRSLLGELLARELPEIVIHPSSATFLAWLDCRALGLGDDPAALFVARGRVALSSGLAYDPAAAGFARFNYATSPEVITEAVTRMRASLG